jgi:8-oxo-dGTP pyrophosphatase MutT (NUDIX family)
MHPKSQRVEPPRENRLGSPYVGVNELKLFPEDDPSKEFTYTGLDVAACVHGVLLTKDERIVLVNQQRPLSTLASRSVPKIQRFLELPGGFAPEELTIARTLPESELEKAVIREILEETGVTQWKSMQKLGSFAPYPQLSNELSHEYALTEVEIEGAVPQTTEDMEANMRTVIMPFEHAYEIAAGVRESAIPIPAPTAKTLMMAKAMLDL